MIMYYLIIRKTLKYYSSSLKTYWRRVKYFSLALEDIETKTSNIFRELDPYPDDNADIALYKCLWVKSDPIIPVGKISRDCSSNYFINNVKVTDTSLIRLFKGIGVKCKPNLEEVRKMENENNGGMFRSMEEYHKQVKEGINIEEHEGGGSNKVTYYGGFDNPEAAYGFALGKKIMETRNIYVSGTNNGIPANLNEEEIMLIKDLAKNVDSPFKIEYYTGCGKVEWHGLTDFQRISADIISGETF